MRVPPPGQLKLDRQALLRDLRDRLAERMPAYADADDPTDPGWLLMEQAAWMVEMLSEQLDQYPYRMVQHLVHMMGGHLRPAQPSVGYIVAEVATEGVMRLDRRRPQAWRFFTRKTEDTDTFEFCPVESGVTLRKATVVSCAEVVERELFTAGKRPGETGLDAQVVRRSERVGSGIFARETLTYTLTTNNADAILASVEGAIEKFNERKVGWLHLEAEKVSDEQVVMTARLDLSLPFAETAPGGLAPGEDLVGDWGVLDSSNWSPPVYISNHPRLRPALRGLQPLPGPGEGLILIPDVPANFPVADLLRRRPSPIPATVADAIWRTIANIDVKLVPMKPVIERSFGIDEETGALEPDWLSEAMKSGLWTSLQDPSPNTVYHVDISNSGLGKGTLRLGLLLDRADHGSLPVIRAYSWSEGGHLSANPLDVAVAWKLPSPPEEEGQGMLLSVALDVQVLDDSEGILLAVAEEPKALTVNPLMVINAPAINDGRTVMVERYVPEAINLLHENIVTREVMNQLLAGPFPADAVDVLEAFTLSSFAVEGDEAVDDWEGVRVDAGDGMVMINAPDHEGYTRDLRPGKLLKLNWYRRADGASADVPADRIRLLEEQTGVRPTLLRINNPCGTFFGADQESPEGAIGRLFGPGGGTPLLPSDYERLVREVLGSRGRGWVVRCWSHGERTLLSTSLWPSTALGEVADAETLRVRDELEQAGPDQLLVIIGPREGRLSDADLDWARRAIRRRIKRMSGRLPVLRGAVVTRFWPLTLHTRKEPDDLLMPAFDMGLIDGKLRDRTGREGDVPSAALMLNAAVTQVVTRGGGDDG